MALNGFDGSGNFIRTFPEGGWKGDAAAAIPIRADRHDDHDQAIANALSNMICKDGQSTVLADIPFNGHRLTNVGDPVNPQDAMTLKSFNDQGVRVDIPQSFTLAEQLTLHTNINDLSSVLPKSADYTLALTDRSKLLFVTADAKITLPAATEVGNDYSVYFRTKGGKITLDALTGVLIEGLDKDFVIPDLASGDIYCDGVNWQVIYNRPGDTSFMGPYRNKLLNGNFDIWQRATTQTTSAIDSDDRWYNRHVGDTKTSAIGVFTPGQTAVPGNPKYYTTTTWTSVLAPANGCYKHQRIEGVRTLQGKKATLTFWAMATANRDIALELQQYFGTGGTPSAAVSVPMGKKSITTSWAKYQAVVDIPSITGKLIGTQATDFLDVYFWFDAGANFDARTSTLGQSSGSVSLARVSLVEGDATGEPDPFAPRHIAEELVMCQRYCQLGGNVGQFSAPVFVGNPYIAVYPMSQMRGTPTVTLTNAAAGYFPATVGTLADILPWGFYEQRIADTTSNAAHFGSRFVAEAEL